MLARHIQIEKFGGPEVMELKTITLPTLAADAVLIKQNIIGFNYLDLKRSIPKTFITANVVLRVGLPRSLNVR